MRKESMMGSSKYEFEPKQFEKDVANKRKVQYEFREDLREVLYRDYKYDDGTNMSNKAKRSILVKVHKEFIGG